MGQIGFIALSVQPHYANDDQVIWSEPKGLGREIYYCHDDKARLRWRVTPNGPFPAHGLKRIPGVGGWLLRPKDRVLCVEPMVYKLPVSIP